jgi:hypothetical protein
MNKNGKEEEILIGWKWVHACGDTLVSLSETGPSMVIYKELEWTTPKEGSGPLCVYGIGEGKYVYGEPYGSLRMYKCKYKPSNEYRVWRKDGSQTFLRGLLRGTVLASAVMLLPTEEI